ncbi:MULTISPECIES: hypothetical protein [unclassified Mucilaginibacter]|uniref:hypothetical protein n=1 Tax=unclassified Mucilaginibacter TaxID=2617802 RepID=UPI002AC9B2C5|nr:MULTISPECIES: hypothetical protein [unclassified Mucilaginibacter]MEB0261608.1 hypothetical protein [Mucilaginibacter sp. 10I4]MEB0277138.1 hypothetical protein [Mucilaginibacter sp. 10B2]MEB0301416.1 hypothetical protein [Mucilaginibacter sp. 5C4]WPX25238.1 hypothetical protein RHM67_08155 [Mucilaginibacter sp. 5C4]
MKNFYFKNKTFKSGLIFLMAFCGIIYGCRKEISKTDKAAALTITNSQILAAKSWYEVKFTKRNENSGKVTNSLGDEFDLSQFFNPDWKDAKNYSRFDDDVIEMPVDSASKIGLKIGSAQPSTNNSRSTVLILKDGESYNAYVMTIIGDDGYINGDSSKLAKNTYAKHDDDFSGILYYSTPQGKFVSGYFYKNGIITGQMVKDAPPVTNSSLVTQSIKKEINLAQICTAWYYTTQYTQADGTLTSPKYFYGGQDCYYTSIDIGSSGGSGGSGNGAGSGGGGGSGSGTTTPAPPKIPCDLMSLPGRQQINGVKVQKYKSDPTWDGGFPSPTTPSPCTQVAPKPLIINVSQLRTNFPCAVKLILDKLMQNPNYNNLVLPFATTKKPDLNWNNASLSWNSPNPMIPGSANTYMLGKTSTFGRSADITLNTNMLQNSSQLIIAAAVIHETIHAYINYNIKTYVDDFKIPANYSSEKPWLYALNTWAIMDGLPTNYRDHNEMMTDYFNQAVSALKSWDNNSHTDKEYAMTMLYGLDTGDFAVMQSSLAQTYSAIMARYNITSSNLQTFWSSQITANVGKLPTGGC